MPVKIKGWKGRKMVSLFPLAQIKLGLRPISSASASGFTRLSQRFYTTTTSTTCSSQTSAMAATDTKNLQPPVAKKVKHEMEMFGDVRVDNYYWLRDDSRSNPEILSHLQQENAYTDFIMSGNQLPSTCTLSI